MNVLDMIRKEFNIDENRTYLMGHSMGGAGSIYLGVKYASIWAAVGAEADREMKNGHKEAQKAHDNDSSFPRGAWERRFHRSAVIRSTGTRSVRACVPTRSVGTRVQGTKRTET